MIPGWKGAQALKRFSVATAVFLLIQTPASSAPRGASLTVVKVTDGDTVQLSSGDKVRIRWINAPEKRGSEPYSEEATRYMARLVLNRKVHISTDPDNERDGYGRLIAGLRVGRTDVSTALIEQGLAHLFVIPPENGDYSALVDAQKRARSSGRGIWTTSRYRGMLHITSFHANAPGDDRDNVNGEYLRVCNITSEPVTLGDFKLRNANGRSWQLPDLILQPGHTVKIHSGTGSHQEDPTMQLTAYLGSRQPVWSNSGDRATIVDAAGRIVDEVVYGGAHGRR